MYNLPTQATQLTVRSSPAIAWSAYWRAIEAGGKDFDPTTRLEATAYIAGAFAFADDGVYMVIEV